MGNTRGGKAERRADRAYYLVALVVVSLLLVGCGARRHEVRGSWTEVDSLQATLTTGATGVVVDTTRTTYRLRVIERLVRDTVREREYQLEGMERRYFSALEVVDLRGIVSRHYQTARDTLVIQSDPAGTTRRGSLVCDVGRVAVTLGAIAVVVALLFAVLRKRIAPF